MSGACAGGTSREFGAGSEASQCARLGSFHCDLRFSAMARAGHLGNHRSMDKPRHLLVVVDPTAIRHPAVERARCLALAFAARVELFVCYQPQPAGDLRVDERVLERIANGLREQGIETTTSESSSPAIHVGIVEKVRQCLPALVIKDAHPHSLLRRTLLPNTDWQLLRTCPAPLLFVRDTACA